MTNVGTSVDDSLDTTDKPNVRKRAVKLANQLWRYYKVRGEAIPTKLERWKIIGQTDRLAVVRKAWKGV